MVRKCGVAGKRGPVQIGGDDAALDQPVAAVSVAVPDAVTDSTEWLRVGPEHGAPAVVLVAGEDTDAVRRLSQQLTHGTLAPQPVAAAVDESEPRDAFAGPD